MKYSSNIQSKIVSLINPNRIKESLNLTDLDALTLFLPIEPGLYCALELTENLDKNGEYNIPGFLDLDDLEEPIKTVLRYNN